MKNGLGLRPPHYQEIIETLPEVGWFEVITENFIFSHGNARNVLKKMRKNYPLVTHGVSLNIGSTDKTDFEFLEKLRSFVNEFEFEWISDHLCWTGIHGKNSHDLLPVPYTRDSMENCVKKINEAQEFLKRELVIENPSSYLEFQQNEYSEQEFLVELINKTGCKLLLDVNNVFVSAFNHKYDAKDFINAIPGDTIKQIHLAGHSNNGDHIIDTHDNFVIDEVWSLFEFTLQKHGFIPSMIEWDANIPEFNVLYSEYEKLNTICRKYL